MPIPTGYAQVNCFFGGGNTPQGAQCTIGFDLEIYAGTPTDLCVDFNATWLASGIMSRLATGTDYTGCLAKFGPDATGPSAVVSTTVVGTGGNGSAVNTAFLVHKNTADGGRAGRGRWYLPGVPEAAVGGDGAISGTAITNLDGELAELLTGWAADNITPVVLHGVGSPITVPSPITSLKTDGVAGTQRRRMR